MGHDRLHKDEHDHDGDDALNLGAGGIAEYGVAELDSGGKIPTSELPDAIVGAMQYQGTWDASGGTYPTTFDTGYYWVVSVAGTISGTDYEVGDWIVNNGDDTTPDWQKIDNSDKVSSVDGQTGAVDLSSVYKADFSENTGFNKDLGSSSGTVCEGDDARLSDARTPTAHNLGGAEHNADTLANLNTKVSDATLDDSSDTRDPNAHATEHTDGTDDIQDATATQKGLATSTQITKLDGIATGADVTGSNAPQAHNTSHEDGGGDEIQIENLPTTATSKTKAIRADGTGGLEWKDNVAELLIKPNDFLTSGVGTFTNVLYLSDSRISSAHYGTGSNQNGFIFTHFALPEDFDSFRTNGVEIEVYRNGSPDIFTIALSKSGTNDTNLNNADVTPTADTTFEQKTFTPAGTYSAGDKLLIGVRSRVDSGVYAEVTTIRLKYNRRVV